MSPRIESRGCYKIIIINKIVVNVFYEHWRRRVAMRGEKERTAEREEVEINGKRSPYLFNIIFNQSHQINCLWSSGGDIPPRKAERLLIMCGWPRGGGGKPHTLNCAGELLRSLFCIQPSDRNWSTSLNMIDLQTFVLYAIENLEKVITTNICRPGAIDARSGGGGGGALKLNYLDELWHECLGKMNEFDRI